MTVHLVGAGPGDPGLLTRRAAELLASADVVVHDRLVDDSVLALVRDGARLVDVGKSAGSPVPSQDSINQLLADEARRGAVVVRLKGGDPFLFGRGAEEVLALEREGIDCRVVPGVSSAFAVPAAAGVPVTHRGLASSVSVLTGHDLLEAASGEALEHLAAAGGTLVVLMGAATHRRLAERLLACGHLPATPVLVVEHGSLPEQRSWRGTLAELAGAQPAPRAAGTSGGVAVASARPDAFESPALIVVGAVAGLALPSYEDRPLSGWQVVVTRAEHQAATLVNALSAAAARPIELPAIALEPPADGGLALAAAARRLSSYDWVVFTSANTVERLFPLLHDARDFGAAGVAAIGPGTAAALARWGVVADLVPPRLVAEGLLEEFPSAPLRPPGATEAGHPRVLLPRAARARQTLPEGLAKLGWQVEVVEAYRTVTAAPSPALLERLAAADAVTFTSSSAVRSFLELTAGAPPPPVVASIGPVTTATATEAGLAVAVEAEVSTIAGLVESLSAYARLHGRPGR